MLRSYDQIRCEAQASRLVAAGERCTILGGGGERYRTRWHWHDCAMILLPVTGSIEFRDETRQAGTWLAQDRFVVVPKSQPHETAAEAAHRHLAIYLTDGLIAGTRASPGSLARLSRHAGGALVFAVTADIRALQRLCSASATDNMRTDLSRLYLAAALLARLLAQIERAEPLPSANTRDYGEMLMAEVRSFIDERLCEELSLDAIAGRFGLSRRHLTRLFRQWSGVSVADYQKQRRLRVAQNLLIDTTLPVGEIAWRVGFESGSALARAMRRVMGRSPSDIRICKNRRAEH